MNDPQPFDVCGPLPTGTTVLEASAGTGKTFAIAALATRFVADGMPLENMLLVTFTRMATGELRERVRARLATAESGLATVLAGRTIDPDDAVLALLADGEPEDVELRRARLSTALADFDAATITTTHGFCHQMLSGLGVTGDVEPGADIVERPDDLVSEVVDDRYLARALVGSTPPFSLGTARNVAQTALNNPGTPIAPPDGGDRDSEPWLRVRLALTVRDEIERRKRRRGTITYDDLLTRLSDALRDPTAGRTNCRRLRERFRVVLVDEFQDTDELQWRILSDAFRHEAGTLVLIGDPKQAIYAFRGAEVHAYLEATAAADHVATLSVNWRSDLDLINAYDAIFAEAALGHPNICYRPVEAAPHHHTRGLAGAPKSQPLRVRIVDREHPEVSLTPTGAVGKPAVREIIARDVAADVVDLLSSGATLRAGAGQVVVDETIRPRHIAVLTRRNRDAATVRDALEAVGVPAVIHGAGSVFATSAALDWLRLLEALERPGSDSRVRAAALTPFIGLTAADLDAADDTRLEELHATVYDWAQQLRTSGVASLQEHMARSTALAERMLAIEDGERGLTDLRHVGQLLHDQASSGRLGITAMTAWVRERIGDTAADAGSEERSRRLESDAEAVQVLTIHACKGLEFPVVYFPYLWDPSWIPDEHDAVVYHDRDAAERRMIDVTGQGNTFRQHVQWHKEEARGEDLRLLYVALTRAKHQAVIWWTPTFDSQHSALGRLAFERTRDGSVPAFGPKRPRSDADIRAGLETLVHASGGQIELEQVHPRAANSWSDGAPTPTALTAAQFNRSIDHTWRRTSYSSLTASAHDAVVTSEPEQHGQADDETMPDASPRSTATSSQSGIDADTEARLRCAPLLLGEMAGGTRVGTVLHSVLESVDFAAHDLDAVLDSELEAALAHSPTTLGDRQKVHDGLKAAITTPLGPLVAERSLADATTADRLDELTFELPIAGGDQPAGTITVHAIADLLDRHLSPDDPVRGYGELLRDPSFNAAFHGYLTGSIDLVLRLPGQHGGHSFTVVDYKSNHLSGDQPPSAWHYRPSALADAMQRAHYPLQALLYQVALHRYLRWRLPDYDPDRHLAGILYLFLRGMAGPDTPRVDGQPCGVFAWRPPTALIDDLSELLEEGSAA